MKILIVEEALRTKHGHWFQYIKDIYEGGKAAGHQIDVLTHRDAVPEIREVFGKNQVLSRSVYNRPKTDFGYKRLLSIWKHNRTLFNETRKWVEANDKYYDATILPSMRIDHVLAAHWMEKSDKDGRFGSIIAIFADTVGHYPTACDLVFPRGTLLLKWAMQYSGCSPKRPGLVFTTESQGLIEQYRKFCGLSLKYLPHVTVLPETVKARTREPKQVPIIGTFGFTRYDKGTDVLHDALELMAPNERKNAEFVVQWTSGYTLPDGTVIDKNPVLTKSFDFTYIEPFSKSEEYHEWLCRVDAIVLPYRESFYKDKLSRVAIDAAISGLPIIYPQRTWLESFVATYGAGIPFEPDDPQTLARAIAELVKNLPKLEPIAKQRASRARSDFSAQSFFDLISEYANRS